MALQGFLLSRFAKTVALTLLFILLIWSPWPLGSNRAPVWYANAILAGLMFSSILLAGLQNPAGLSILWQRHKLSLCGMAIVTFWAFLQYWPLDLPGLSHPLWEVLESRFGQDIAGRVTINPELTWLALVRHLTYCAVFISVFVLALDSRKAHWVLIVLIVSGIGVALYGLAVEVSGGDSILWFEKRSYLGFLTATFINRNSAATYFGLMSLIALAFAMRKAQAAINPKAVRRSRDKLVMLFEAIPGGLGLWMIITILMLTALTLTASRAGLGSTLVAAMVLILVMQNRGKSSRLSFLFAMTLLALVLTIIEISGAGLAQRFVMESIHSHGRMDVYLITLSAISDHIWTGTGLGTFEDVFLMYLDGTSPLASFTWDKAHNSYLELFLGLGVPAALVFLAILLAWVWQVLSGIFRRRKNQHYAALALSGSVLVGLHSLVDFSLQIQAVALVYITLLAMGLAQSYSSRDRTA
jgi:O-antigen ligase